MLAGVGDSILPADHMVDCPKLPSAHLTLYQHFYFHSFWAVVFMSTLSDWLQKSTSINHISSSSDNWQMQNIFSAHLGKCSVSFLVVKDRGKLEGCTTCRACWGVRGRRGHLCFEPKTQDTCRVSKSRTAAVIQLFVETVSLGQFSLFVFSIWFLSHTAGAAAAAGVQHRSYQQ